MTLVFILDGEVSLDPAFVLLPITRIEFSPPKRQKKKFELPHCPEPGAILSVRYSGDTRGIIRSSSSTYFKNSITVDLSTKTKNVSIKLSRSKIQMCGAPSEEQGREGAQHLIDHLMAIQEELDYIKEHRQEARATLDWIVEATRGEKIERPVHKVVTEVSIDEDGDEIKDKKEVFSHHEVDYTIVEPSNLEQAPDARIAAFLLRQAKDFDYHSYLISELEWILEIERVTTRSLSIKKVVTVMVNYNYNLGFKVNRYVLYQEMMDRNGFVSSYDNCVEHCVKIKLPYTLDDDEKIVRRKNKIPCHCFLVYKSGVVTQTGPCIEKIREAYNAFWKSILEIKDKIMLEPAPTVRIIRRR